MLSNKVLYVSGEESEAQIKCERIELNIIMIIVTY